MRYKASKTIVGFILMIHAASLSAQQPSPKEGAKPAGAQPSSPRVDKPTPSQVEKPTPPRVEKPSRPAPEPPQHRYPDSMKSPEFKQYVDAAKEKLNGGIAELDRMKAKIDAMEPGQRSKVLPYLQTTEGNRSVARTKLRQMDYNPPEQWATLRNGVDSAIANFEQSLSVLKTVVSDSPAGKL